MKDMRRYNSYSATLRRTNRARNFPTNTCGASRHAVLIARRIYRGDVIDPMDREGCAVSILATVGNLWRIRTAEAKRKGKE